MLAVLIFTFCFLGSGVTDAAQVEKQKKISSSPATNQATEQVPKPSNNPVLQLEGDNKKYILNLQSCNTCDKNKDCAAAKCTTWWQDMSGLFTPLAWPLLILTLALIFKKDIKDVLRRLKSVNKDGFELHPASPAVVEYSRRSSQDHVDRLPDEAALLRHMAVVRLGYMLNAPFSTDIAYPAYDDHTVFDAYALKGDTIYVAEIKFLRNPSEVKRMLDSLGHILEAVKYLSREARDKGKKVEFSLVVIGSEEVVSNRIRLESELLSGIVSRGLIATAWIFADHELKALAKRQSY